MTDRPKSDEERLREVLRRDAQNSINVIAGRAEPGSTLISDVLALLRDVRAEENDKHHARIVDIANLNAEIARLRPFEALYAALLAKNYIRNQDDCDKAADKARAEENEACEAIVRTTTIVGPESIAVIAERIRARMKELEA